jgi:mono/diheme cytochrome c family protein
MKNAPILLLAVLVAVALPAQAQDKAAATQELYRSRCQMCHMADGNAPVAQMNLSDGNWIHGSKKEDVVKVISEGAPGTAMLPFKAQLTPEQISALADHVRAFDKSLAASKSKKK